MRVCTLLVDVLSVYRSGRQVRDGSIAERTKKEKQEMSKTGLENKFRVIKDGTIEPKRQQDKTREKMFQFMKMKKKGNRK